MVTTHTAQTAYEKVLLYAGASLVRDSYDQRIVSETTTGTAAFKGLSPYNGLGSVTYPAGTVIGNTTLTTTTTIDWKSTSYPKWGIIDSQNDIRPADAPADWSAWPTLAQGELKTDANRDGIPDEWLASNFPGKKSTDLNEEGYTYLEVYLNSIEMGNGIYGAEAAARHYWKTTAKNLSRTQAAAIAAVLPNPRKYSANPPGPYVQSRIGWIVGQMGQWGTLKFE